MRLLTRTYILPDDRLSDWDLLDGGQTVAVLALTPESEVLLVRQYRPGPGVVLDELPGGFVDAGEHVRDAAVRELLEETGHVGDVEVAAQTWIWVTWPWTTWECSDSLTLRAPMERDFRLPPDRP